MYLIKIERKKLCISVCIVLCISVIVVLLNTIPDGRMSASTFLAASDTIEENAKNIEIFDISKGLVIFEYKPNSVFQNEAISYLKAITGMYANVNVFPKSGYIVKTPLDPPFQTSGKWLASTGLKYIDKVYVIFPTQSEPYLLVLDAQSNPLCFNFEADTSTLQEYFIELVNSFEPQKPPKQSMEELYHDISITMLFPYVHEAIDDYYEINTGYSPSIDPWDVKILLIEKPNGRWTFDIKLEVSPYLGAHNSIGVDQMTFQVSLREVKLEKYEHIKSHPIPPWLQHTD